jgi:hypothetical protein
MLIDRITSVLLLAACLLPGVPCQAAGWPERPRLEDYREYSRFLEAMTAYRHALRETPVTPPLSLGIALPVSSTLQELSVTSSEMMDPLSEEYPAPLQITGPENMDEAVEKAKNFIHPVYTARLRYQRTTSFSFPLAKAANELLEKAAAADELWGADSINGAAMLDKMLYADELLSAEHAGTSHERWAELALSPMAEGVIGVVGRVSMPFGAGVEVMIESVRR